MIKKIALTIIAVSMLFTTEFDFGHVINAQTGDGQLYKSSSTETMSAITDGYDYISYKYVDGISNGDEIVTFCINDADGECVYRFDYDME